MVVSRRLGYSSPEITLKYYAYLWIEMLATCGKMKGNFKLNISKETYPDFNGNQDIRMELIPYQNSAMGEDNLEESSDTKVSKKSLYS